MTFEQEVKAVVSALLTAVFVSGGGWWITTRWQARRAEFEVRTALVERTARSAQAMYVACQHASRVQGHATLDAQSVAGLDAAYHEFSAESAALQTVAGARYG